MILLSDISLLLELNQLYLLDLLLTTNSFDEYNVIFINESFRIAYTL